MLIYTCDECGKTAKGIVSLETGHVYIDNEYHGQSCDLCEEHYPKTGKSQPNNCKKVHFHWPKGE